MSEQIGRGPENPAVVFDIKEYGLNELGVLIEKAKLPPEEIDFIIAHYVEGEPLEERSHRQGIAIDKLERFRDGIIAKLEQAAQSDEEVAEIEVEETEGLMDVEVSRRPTDPSEAKQMPVRRTKIRSEALLSADQEVELSKTIEAGEIASWAIHMLKQAKEIPTAGLVVNDVAILSAEAMREYTSVDELVSDLEDMVRAGKQAKTTFIERNLGLVHAEVNKYGPHLRRIEVEDLAHEVILNGLDRAIMMFNYTKGFKFSTYATPWINRAIQVALAENDEAVGINSTAKKEIARLKSHYMDLKNTLGRSPSADELAESMDVTKRKIIGLLEASNWLTPLELNATAGDDEFASELGDLVPDTGPTVPEQALRGIVREELEKIVCWLPEGQQAVIRLKYFTHDPMTTQEISSLLGVSKQTVYEREKKALEQLKAWRTGS